MSDYALDKIIKKIISEQLDLAILHEREEVIPEDNSLTEDNTERANSATFPL